MCALGLSIVGVVEHQQVLLAAPDTSNWKCHLCPFQKDTKASVTTGLSTVSDDELRFGHGTGQDEQGAYVVADSDGKGGHDKLIYGWQLSNLGFDSRAGELRVHHAESFDATVSYHAFPARISDSTTTIFQATGAERLSLDELWVRAASTTDFVGLAEQLHPRDIKSDREVFRFKTSVQAAADVQIFTDYRRQEQQGTGVTSGAFFTNASQLAAQRDYAIDEIEAGVRIHHHAGTSSVSLYGSYFDNANDILIWDNPFVSFPGSEAGASAQVPDNSFQQFSLQGSYAIGKRTQFSGAASIGRGEQNQRFLDYTVNSLLPDNTLPMRDLEGRVDTTNLYFSLRHKPSVKLDLDLSYRFDERENRSAQASWSRVIVDSLASGEPEINPLYGSRRSVFHSRVRFKLDSSLRISAGYERHLTNRRRQEVAEQIENTGWGALNWQPYSYFEFELKAGTKKREIDRYNLAIAEASGQNPLFRKFNLAHRYRKFGEMTAHASLPNKPVSLTATVVYADDTYSRSAMGLLNADEWQLGFDANWAWSEQGLLYLNAGREVISAEQSGGAGIGGANWLAEHKDVFVHYGLGVHLYQVLPDMDIMLDYTRASGLGEIHVASRSQQPQGFPDLRLNSDVLQLRLLYRTSPRTTLEMQMQYHRFETEDWALQGVAPDTIASVLTLGAQPYHFNIFQFGLSIKYDCGS
ncbi:MAG: MtrB/PioB family decaheme-associated outer membrane protein [bacterium]